MDNILKSFKVLSDKNRLRILLMLTRRPLCVCEIEAVLDDISVSTVSKHLSILREAGFIIDEKEGKWVNYKINPEAGNQEFQLTLLLSNWLKDDAQITADAEKVKVADRIQICASLENKTEQ